MGGASIGVLSRVGSGTRSGDTSEGQGLYFDPNFESMFEAFALFMQQQKIKNHKEDMANKIL